MGRAHWSVRMMRLRGSRNRGAIAFPDRHHKVALADERVSCWNLHPLPARGHGGQASENGESFNASVRV